MSGPLRPAHGSALEARPELQRLVAEIERHTARAGRVASRGAQPVAPKLFASA